MELRSPDPSCNPYLEIAACLAAGLDGIERGLTPPPETTENIYLMTPEQRVEKGIMNLPASLEEALEAFKADPLMTATMGEHVTQQYIEGKQREWDAYRTRVSNWEIERYLVVY